MRENYQRALRYAMKCCPPLYKDLTHTAYIRHYNKHGTNLFEENLGTVLRYVRNVWFNEVRDRKYQKSGELHTKQFVDIDDLPLSSGQPPDSILISKEFYEELFRRVDNYNSGHRTGWSLSSSVLRKFLDLLNQGYKSSEICEEMNISPQTLHYYKKKLKTIINQMDEINNPFNGNRAIIKKKVSRKVFEEKYKDDYVYDPEKGTWCDYNETAQILVHRDREEYILVKEKTY
jgi:DNA-directed RNA polymerase specialized sigma24 family protein